MGDVAVGDLLLGADGSPTRVVAATEVMLGRPCFEVVFSDGTVIVADAEHQWLTVDGADRRAVRTTQVLARTLRSPDGRPNHVVDSAVVDSAVPAVRAHRGTRSCTPHHACARQPAAVCTARRLTRPRPSGVRGLG